MIINSKAKLIAPKHLKRRGAADDSPPGDQVPVYQRAGISLVKVHEGVREVGILIGEKS